MARRLAQAGIVAAAVALLAFALLCDAPWFDRHVFLPQQFFISAGRALVTAGRATAALLGLILLLLVRSLPRGAEARRLMLALLLAVPVAEVAVRWRLRRLVSPELLAAMDALTSQHPRYGRTFKPSLDDVQSLSGRPIRFHTDAERRRTSGAGIDPSLPSLVFTGESAVAGIGLQWDETFAAVLGARLRLQVVNLASPSYSIDQSWLRLKDALPGLQHPTAVVGIFMPGLIGRSFEGTGHPRAGLSPSGGVELLRPEPPGLLERSGLFRLWHHLYWSEAAIDEGMRSAAILLRDMAALAEQRGAPCVFIVTGHTPQWMRHELFEISGLESVAVEVPRKELLSDGHPSAQGNLRIAEAVERWLRAEHARR